MLLNIPTVSLPSGKPHTHTHTTRVRYMALNNLLIGL